MSSSPEGRADQTHPSSVLNPTDRRGPKGCPMKRLEGQVAIVTGASRGLGQYCAQGFALEGARVAVAARTVKENDPRLPGRDHSRDRQAG